MIKQYLERRRLQCLACREAAALSARFRNCARRVNDERMATMPEHAKPFFQLVAIALEQRSGGRASRDWASR